ncbi:MAG: hypothetical protein HY841_13675 [Bacteroidetes bacterium]|nr:hypothetical protein [Bacteroidota bacterium]
MFEIKEAKPSKKELSYEIYFRKKKLCDGEYDKKQKVVSTDTYVDFEINQIARMKAKDFNDNFCFMFNTEQAYARVFYMFEIWKKGNTISISIYGSLNNNNFGFDWLLWNYKKFVHEATLLAKRKGYGISQYAFEDEWESDYLLFEFDFEAKGSIGQIFNKAIAKGKEIIHETEIKFLKKAMKKLQK